MAIARALIRHTVRVYRELSSADLGKPAAERSDRQQQFLSSLPATFSTQAFLQLAGDHQPFPAQSGQRGLVI